MEASAGITGAAPYALLRDPLPAVWSAPPTWWGISMRSMLQSGRRLGDKSSGTIDRGGGIVT